MSHQQQQPRSTASSTHINSTSNSNTHTSPILQPSQNISYGTTTSPTNRMDHQHQQQQQPRRIGSASFISCVANLSNTILGTGMLAMAHGFAQGGLLVGFLTVLICGSMAYLGLYLLSLCAAHPSISYRKASFSSISKLTYPRASILFDLAIAIKCFGVSISYLLIFGKLMPQLILSFQSTAIIPGLRPADEDHSLWLDRRLWITLAMVILVPVSFLPTLDSLRHTSYVALIGVVNLIVVVIFKFFFSSTPLPSTAPDAQIRWLKLDANFLTALPLFVFAYTCAQNLFSIHNEMISNSPRQMKKVLLTCIGSAVGTYEIVGVLGYLTFGSKVSSNLISDYESSRLISITRLTISLLVLFSYPLQLYPCRSSLIKVFHESFGAHQTLDYRRPTENDQDQEDQDELDQSKPDSIHLFVAITGSLLLSSFLIAVNVERLETILGFVGSTGSTMISYILPGMFFLKMFSGNEEELRLRRSSSNSRASLADDEDGRGVSDEDDRQQEVVSDSLDLRQVLLLRKLALALVLVGVVVMVVCFSLNIHNAFFASPVNSHSIL